jgi:hypothetical protein
VGAFFVLSNRPEGAAWLPADEKHALLSELAHEESGRQAHGPASSLAALKDGRVLYLVTIYFLIQAGVYGVIFYLPTQVASILGKSVGLEVGLISAIPWSCAMAATFLLTRIAGQFRGHRFVTYSTLASLAMAASGLAILVVPWSRPGIALAALCVAASGLIAVQPLYWTFPTGYLSGSGAAAGIAMITMGNLGGFVAPNIKVWAEQHFGSSEAGAISLAALTFLGALLLALLRNPARVSSAEVAEGQTATMENPQ